MNPDLEQQIRRVLPTLQGWCTIAKALTLAQAVLELEPDIVVEIGVYGGGSLVPMALACKHLGRGVVLGIDPWAPAASVEGQTPENVAWWGKLDHEAIMQGFLRAVEALDLTQRVVVQRMRSDDVTPPTVIDFLSVDGNHGEQAFRDVQRFCPHVRVGGLVCLDDVGWEGGHVQRGVEWLLANGFVELYKIGTGAMFKRM